MDYQIERLHIYGEEHPSSGLKNKVVGFQFKQTLDIMDPITRTITKEPMKQFMVTQLSLSFERDRMILSPFDEHLHKQLIDYSVDRISQSGLPIYTSKNEHFVDALGLAHLAFVLKFPDLTQAIKMPEYTSKIEHSARTLGMAGANAALREISSVSNPWANNTLRQVGKDPGERPGDYQKWVKVPMGPKTATPRIWGSRGGSTGGRSLW